MNSLIRPRLFAAAALLLVLGGASYWLGTANAEPSKQTPATKAQKQADRLVPPPSGTGSHDLLLGAKGSAQPTTMEQFLTGRHEGRRRVLDQDVQGLGPAGAEGRLQVDPGRPDRGERVRRRGRHARRQRGRLLPRRRHDLHLGEVRHGHLRRHPRPGAPGQLAGLRQDDRRLLGRLHRGARVRARGPGRARPLRPERAGRSRRWRSSSRPTATPATGRRAPTSENRLQDGDVQEALDAALAVGDFDTSNPSHHGTPEQRADAWNAASSPATRPRAAATWTRPTSATAPARRRPARRRRRTRPTRATAPATASGSSRPPTSTAASPRSAGRRPACEPAGGRRYGGRRSRRGTCKA